MSPVICHHYLKYFKRNCSLCSKVEKYPNDNEFGGSQDENFFNERSLKPGTSIIKASGAVKVSALISELELLTAASRKSPTNTPPLGSHGMRKINPLTYLVLCIEVSIHCASVNCCPGFFPLADSLVISKLHVWRDEFIVLG